MTNQELENRKRLTEIVPNVPVTAENLSPELEGKIRSCIFEYRPGIVYWYECKHVNGLTVELMASEVSRLVKDWDSFVFLVDLTRANKPNAEARLALMKMFEHDKLLHVNVFTGSNILLKVAAKFVLASVLKSTDYQVFRKLENALNGLEEHIQSVSVSA